MRRPTSLRIGIPRAAAICAATTILTLATLAIRSRVTGGEAQPWPFHLDVAIALLTALVAFVPRGDAATARVAATGLVATIATLLVASAHDGSATTAPLLPAFTLVAMAGGTATGALARLLPQRPAMARPRATSQPSRRILILGGGFAGGAVARALERALARDPHVHITLVSDTNHLLFTPMLSEVTAGSLEGSHISAPLRGFLRRTDVLLAKVTAIDSASRRVDVESLVDGRSRTLEADELVVALGATPTFFGLKGVERHALTFKSLPDALAIRNRVIGMLEQANADDDPDRRRELLTFVVAGGGFAGVELVGSLNDFVRGAIRSFPRIDPGELSLVLVHPGERILPELSEGLGRYAQDALARRGVRFVLKGRVSDASASSVSLADGTVIKTRTLVWTAGNSPNPLLRASGLPLDDRGRVVVDATLAVRGRPGVWSLGDGCAVPDLLAPGRFHPPTAQHAIREAATLAHNVAGTLRGVTLAPFRFRALGSFAVLGHQLACAEIRGRRFSGSFAWFLWRTVYLMKLPGLEKKIRVALDWTIDLFFPRDLVHVPERRIRESPPTVEVPPVRASAAVVAERSLA